MPFLRLIALLVALVAGLGRPASAVDISRCGLVVSGRGTVVGIEARLDDGRGVDLQGILVIPSGPGPFPTVVVLPGGGGLVTPYCYGSMVEAFASWGFASLIVASSTTTDTAGQHLYQYSFADQAGHARGAAERLNRIAEIDTRRLAIWGHSRGGLTAIEMAMDPADRGGPYRAIVAAAPQCPGRVLDFHTPLLMVIGTADKDVSVQACQDFATESEGRIGFESLFLPGAGHVFWTEPDAARKSADRVRAFLETHVDQP